MWPESKWIYPNSDYLFFDRWAAFDPTMLGEKVEDSGNSEERDVNDDSGRLLDDQAAPLGNIDRVDAQRPSFNNDKAYITDDDTDSNYDLGLKEA